jgi:hypothetical protein
MTVVTEAVAAVARRVKGELVGNGADGPWKKYGLASVLAVFLLSWMTWMSTQIIVMQREIAVIDGNRFTAQDGAGVMQMIAGIMQRDAVLEERVGGLHIQLNRIEAKLDRLID